MNLTVTHHPEHHTITSDEAASCGAPDDGITHVVYWLSDDAQSDICVGWGESYDAALADAQRVCAQQSITTGTLAVYDVVSA